MNIMNMNPSLYDKTNRLQERDALSLVRIIQEDQVKGLVPQKLHLIIDVGCGPGNLTIRLNQWFSCQEVIGLDSSLEMIDYAVKNHSDKGTSFKTSDIGSSQEDFVEKILGSNKSLSDVVISNHCLHWVPEEKKNQAMANIRNLLKPGGRCYHWIFSWCEILPLEEHMLYLPNWNTYFKGKPVENLTGPFPTVKIPEEERIRSWKQRCQDLKFEKYEVVLKKLNFDFSNWDNFKVYIKILCHFSTFIPEEEQSAFLDDYYDHVNKNYILKKKAMGCEKLYSLDYECLLVMASKPKHEDQRTH